jgi:hypothetical protein
MKKLLFVTILLCTEVYAVPRSPLTPDRETGSAAILLQDNKMIDDKSIPTDVINTPEVNKPDYTIMEGTPNGIDAPLSNDGSKI